MDMSMLVRQGSLCVGALFAACTVLRDACVAMVMEKSAS